MSIRVRPWMARAGVLSLVGILAAARAAAQGPAAPQQEQQHPPQPEDPGGHDMSHMTHDEHSGQEQTSMSREGSGTAWLPDATPVYAMHAQKGAWQIMAHENVFLQFL